MADVALENLRRIQHIVVLMMENRSFDHMLGYLTRAGLADVNGLDGTESNPDDQGRPVRVFTYRADQTSFHRPGRPFDKSLDPEHGHASVAEQLRDGNRGFVRNFIRKKNPPPEWRSLPMGYFTATHLPVYDFLARHYCVCDAWHCSVPTDTWPNRLYALAGRSALPVLQKGGRWQRLVRFFAPGDVWRRIQRAPIFETEAFTRHLAEDQWRWYSYDPATLRATDRRYRDFRRPGRKNFAYVALKEISVAQREVEGAIVSFQDSFLDDATKAGVHGLRAVSWIDPNFIDLRVFETPSNDDHPPSDVRAGQSLVLELYHALVNSPGWPDTLFVITYDEHGGFFDHVAPPRVPAGDNSGFTTYGVRVPALVIGPRVRNFVCHQFFEHTTLIKTILLRFAKDPAAAIKRMGPRVERAQHLGVVLGDQPRRDVPGHDHLFDVVDAWRIAARAERRAAARGQPAPNPDGAGRDWEPTDLQNDMISLGLALRAQGLPPGQP